jgi:ATP:ADP antiporter, AAA family
MSAYIPDFRISRGLAAQVFNNDRLLQETAAWVIYNKDKKAYDSIRDRIPMRDKKFLDNSIEKNQLLDGLDDGFFLGIEIVMFLKTVQVFKNVNGAILCDLADKVQPVDVQKNEVIKFKTEAHNAPIFIIAHGAVQLRNNDEVIHNFVKGDVYGDLFQDGPPVPADNFIATERTVIFKVDIMDFYFVMANHHELVQGLIKNITENKEETEVKK